MLFLKKLRINGFKSFANKTDLIFKPGIAGIVGPNGCGKSNIVDALKWVFGEKRVKALRGETATDIIFAGNEEIKPLGMAEVEITINNADSLLPVEYSEISVARRVFRSGENEYYINKQKCRLKDIHALFANTGVGKGSYSFMEQGKIDMILSSKPEDRRTIFEEAAGISGYKSKLKETMQALNGTENNLNQVNLLIKEISKEREIYKKQSETAKIYEEKQKKLKELETYVYVNRYLTIEEKLKKLLEKINLINEKLASAKKDYEKIDEKLAEINKELVKQNNDKNKYEKDKISLQHQIDNNNEKSSIYSHQLRNYEAEFERYEKKKEFLKVELNKLEKELNDNELLFKQKESQLNTILEKIKVVSNTIDDKNLKINLNYETINKNRITIKNNQEKLIKLKEELRTYTDEFIKEIDIKKQEVESRDDYQQNFKTKVIDLIKNVESNLTELETSADKQDIEKTKNIVVSIKNTLSNLKNIIQDIVIHQDEFKNLIFDKDGAYAKKENIDVQINKISDEIFKLQNEISELDSQNQILRKEEKEFEKKREELYNNRNALKQGLVGYEHSINNLKTHIERNKKELITIDNDIKELKNKKSKLKNNIKELENKNKDFLKELKNIETAINKFLAGLKKNNQSIEETHKKGRNLLEKIEKLTAEFNEKNEDKIKLDTNLEDIKTFIYEEYNIKLEDALKTYNKDIDIKKINSDLEKIKKEIKGLGHINLLAGELYDDVNKRFNLYIAQREDLLKSKEDLLQIIESVNKESEKLFLDTFNKIKESYHKIFRKLFGGGKASIELTDKENILESGVEINVQPPGKKPKSIDWLSGGERTLSAIGLMFSIFIVKPSPFCVLDEIDAALDEENINKFLKLMQEFSNKTQFLIVSHNKMTIAACSYLYGVTMEDKGVSKIVSLDLRKTKIDDYIK